jgi:hypothetical protein
MSISPGIPLASPKKLSMNCGAAVASGGKTSSSVNTKPD